MVFRNVRIVSFQMVVLYGWIYIYIYIQYYFPIKTKMIINLITKFKDETQLMEIIMDMWMLIMLCLQRSLKKN